MSSVPDRRRRPRILLGVTGSVAAVKGPQLAVRLASACGADVRVLLTRGGESFWSKAGEYDAGSWEAFRSMNRSGGSGGGKELAVTVHGAADEWGGWERMGDPVLHIELRDWADAALVAPLSAHTLAKFAAGLCDDTLTCVLRAWDFGHGDREGKPLVLAPALNTAMWGHPLTKSQLDSVRGFWNRESGGRNGIVVVEPQVKKLACGEVGRGALASVADIVQAMRLVLSNRKDEAQNGGRAKIDPERGARIRGALVSLAKKRHADSAAALDAPISPTPDSIIDLVLPKLDLGGKSLLVDLGCGDGRWIIRAAKQSGCRCIGCDLDNERLALAQTRVESHGLSDRVEVRKADIFEFARSSVIEQADVVVLYLFREAMLTMSEILRQRRSMRNFTIVSIGFTLPSFVPSWEGESKGIRVFLY